MDRFGLFSWLGDSVHYRHSEQYGTDTVTIVSIQLCVSVLGEAISGFNMTMPPSTKTNLSDVVERSGKRLSHGPRIENYYFQSQ